MTALIVGCASRRGAKFSISLDWVAISREAVEGVIACVQYFVGDVSFPQRNFCSDIGVAMLQDAVAAVDSVIVSEDYNPCTVFGDGCNQQVVSDLQSCQEETVPQCKASRYVSERWFGAHSAESPSAVWNLGRSGARISKIVEEGQMECVAVPKPTASSARSVKSAAIGVKRRHLCHLDQCLGNTSK